MDIGIKLEIDGRPVPLNSLADLQTVKNLIDIVLRSQDTTIGTQGIPSPIQGSLARVNGGISQPVSPEARERLNSFRERQQTKRVMTTPPPGERALDYAIKAWFTLGKDMVTLTEMTEQMLLLGWGTTSVSPESVARSGLADAKRFFKKLPDRRWKYIGPPLEELEVPALSGQHSQMNLEDIEAEEAKHLAEIRHSHNVSV